MMKRTVVFLLLLAMMLSALCACNGNKKNPTPTGDVDTTPTRNPAIPEYLPERDFGGETLTVATYDLSVGDGVSCFYVSDAAEEDVVSSAVLRANRLAMENFHFTITPTIYSPDSQKIADYVRQNSLSGDICDLVNGHDCTMLSLAVEGYFADLKELNNIDFSQNWYPQYANDEYEINGKQYIFSSYMSYQSLAYARCFLFNKSLANNYDDLEVPYDTVIDGDWTLDYFYSMVKDFHVPDGGDGENDVYGWIAYSKLYGFQGAYINCYRENDNGKITLNYSKDRMDSLVSGLRTVLFDSDGGKVDGTEPELDIFVKGQSLFYYINIGAMTSASLRDSAIDYALLPVPKYDKSQDDYITPTFDAMFAIPKNTVNSERTSFLVEAMSGIGYNTIRNEYMNEALSLRYAPDAETGTMLDYISNGLIVDLAYLNTSAGVSGLGRTVMYCLSYPKVPVTSYLAMMDNSEAQLVKKLNKFFGTE